MPVLVGVDGDPQAGRDPYDAAWQLGRESRDGLSTSSRYQGPYRERLLIDYAHQRGRISSTEAAALLGMSTNTARALLDDLERAGTLVSGREHRRGRGFFYVPADPTPR